MSGEPKIIQIEKHNRVFEVPTLYLIISLLPALGKILERVISDKLNIFFEDNNITFSE